MKKDKLYILLQLGGWSIYIILYLFILQASNEPINLESLTLLFLVFTIGIGVTHLYRNWITRKGWTRLEINKIFYRVVISAIILSFLAQTLYFLGASLMLFRYPSFDFFDISIIINWIVLLSIWSIIYFAYQFFERYRTEEIKNLKWEATKNEIELNKLKSQLNPHFIFN